MLIQQAAGRRPMASAWSSPSDSPSALSGSTRPMQDRRRDRIWRAAQPADRPTRRRGSN